MVGLNYPEDALNENQGAGKLFDGGIKRDFFQEGARNSVSGNSSP